MQQFCTTKKTNTTTREPTDLVAHWCHSFGEAQKCPEGFGKLFDALREFLAPAFKLRPEANL
jgi:hypothetical protein